MNEPMEQPLADPLPRFPRVIYHQIRGRPAEGERDPLPSGHPVSWGALIAGSIIDGAPYPLPVFGQ